MLQTKVMCNYMHVKMHLFLLHSTILLQLCKF